MKAKELRRGGARSGAGRKPIPEKDRKKGVWIYVNQAIICNAGGEIAFKEKCTTWANEKFQNTSIS